MKHEDLYEQSRSAYDRIAHGYGLKDGFEDIDEDLLNLFVKHLGASARILDLGCGPGQYARRFVAVGHWVVAVDNSAEMIAELGRRGAPEQLTAVCADMRKLDFPADSFDGIFASASLIHITEDELPAVLATLRRVLRSTGVMMANFAISDRGLRFERRSAKTYSSQGRFFQHFASADIVLSHLEAAGFSLVESTSRVVRPVLDDGTLGRIEWHNLVLRCADAVRLQ